MPSTSAKQAKFMKAVANNPKFAKKVGVAQSVGKDFEMADKKKGKFGRGGPTNVEPKGFKPLVRIDLDKAREDTAVRDATAKRDAAQKAAMKKKYPFNKYAEGGKTMKKMGKMTDKMTKKAGGGKCYAKGGSVSSRADGCATKGKTATKMVAMKRGGKC